MTNIKYSHKLIILILFFIVSFFNLHADSPCSTFFIKATLHTKSGSQESVYLTFDYTHTCYESMHMYFNGITEYSTIHQRIPLSKVDFKKLNNIDSSQYNKILAVNKSVVIDTIDYLDYECNYSDLLPTANKIYQFTYSDTTHYTGYSIHSDHENKSFLSLDSSINTHVSYTDIIHYSQAKYINLDTIKLIVLDSILWCDDFQQIQWLNKNQIANLKSKKIVSYFSVDNGLYYWIDFFSYDPYWTKYRIQSSLNLEKIDQSLDVGGSDIFNAFSPLLQKAIQSNKIVYFVRSSP